MMKPKLPRLNKNIGGTDIIIKPVDYFDTVENKKSAPYEAFKFNNGSCISLKILKEMAIAYNKLCKDDKLIKILDYDISKTENDPELKEYKLYLLSYFTELYGKEQQKWLKEPFIEELSPNIKIVLEQTYRPKGPATSTKWLNQLDIDNVCNQYELEYSNYKYLGCLPADHIDLDEYLTKKYSNFKLFDDDFKKGIHKYSYITNTDSSGQSGQHWRCLLFDTKEFNIYFIDSVGNNPLQKDMPFINLVIEYMKSKNNGKMPDYRIGKTRHQKSNTECGVYGLYFTIEFLKGISFDKFESHRVEDSVMIELRNKVFSK